MQWNLYTAVDNLLTSKHLVVLHTTEKAAEGKQKLAVVILSYFVDYNIQKIGLCTVIIQHGEQWCWNISFRKYIPLGSDMNNVHALVLNLVGIGMLRHMWNFTFISGHLFSIETTPSLRCSLISSGLATPTALLSLSISLATVLLTCWSSKCDVALYSWS